MHGARQKRRPWFSAALRGAPRKSAQTVAHLVPDFWRAAPEARNARRSQPSPKGRLPKARAREARGGGSRRSGGDGGGSRRREEDGGGSRNRGGSRRIEEDRGGSRRIE